jgi:signal transduction histidine kinase/DNA-binding response OmpR family regulator
MGDRVDEIGQKLVSPESVTANFFLGGGEMGLRMRDMDWAKTSLGPVETWSQSLKTSVRIMLTCRQPMFVWWGEDLINLYNDAYKSVVGGKHPMALGQPASDVWREIWDQVGPRAEFAMRNNEGTYDEALLLIMERNGYPEETYYTFSYSPVPDDQGGTGGIICANIDDTQRIIGKRQLALLQELAARTADARTFDQACTLSARCLGTNPYDLPFAMIYLVDPDRQQASLAGTAGIDRNHAAVPATVDLKTDSTWQLAEVVSTHQLCLISDLNASFSDLPAGAWDRSPYQAAAVPIAPSGETGKAGILVVGLNPFRLFDDSYRGFIDLIASQIAASIANAQAYEEERKRAEALAELDRAKTVFFSNVSHEFRTPLTLMLGPLEETLNQSGSLLPPPDREQLEMVQRNGQRLLKLVNTLLDFSRIEAGRMQVSYEPIDLASFTAELASVFRSAIERAGIQLLVNCPPLPVPVYVDREMWEKIVLNLLSNAFKFTFTGEICVNLRLATEESTGADIDKTTSPSSSCVILEVQDTGIGIPAEELPHLFERFHRVRGAQGRTFEGSGIGLSLVQELVQIHGGTVQVRSTLGAGSCFIVSIPTGSAHLPLDRISAARTLASTAIEADFYLAEALHWLPEEGDAEIRQDKDNQEALPLSSPSVSSVPLSSAPHVPFIPSSRILLADDNADMRDYVRRLLGRSYEVEAVSDGLAALAAAQHSVPDLVLTDIMMPGLDGFGLLQQLRANPQTREVPIILLSARAGEEARVEGLEAGADDYLTKPFSARELLARVEAALKMARLRQEAMQREQGLRLEAEMAKARLENVLAGIQDQFYVLDQEWRYTFISDRVAEVVGIPKTELLGQCVWENFPDLVDSEFYTQVHRARVDQTAVQFDYFYPAWQRWFENRIYPFDGGVSVFVTEITDRKLAEAERDRLLQLEQAARADAEQANRIKDEFLAVLSHELRSPLNPIVGWAKLLRTRQLDEKTTQRALETIERSAQVQTQLIEDLLDVSRILQGKLSLHVAPVDLAVTIQSAMETVRLSAEARAIQVHTSLADVGYVAGDPNRLQQVVWNLVSNAIKFTAEGGRVDIRLERCGSQVQLMVSDTGKGIDPAFLPHVFDYFRQEDAATTRRFGGLGLGLAIVRYLVELHGGTVRADSPGEGQGATFTVRLPLMPASSAVSLNITNAEPSLSLNGINVLVVDDDDSTREFLTILLNLRGATVTAVASASDALIALTHSKPDVLLSDIGMPIMDGYMLMQQVRQLPAEQGGQVPAIALTAYAGEIDHQRALRAGFQKHVAKPVEPFELVREITNLIQDN